MGYGIKIFAPVSRNDVIRSPGGCWTLPYTKKKSSGNTAIQGKNSEKDHENNDKTFNCFLKESNYRLQSYYHVTYQLVLVKMRTKEWYVMQSSWAWGSVGPGTQRTARVVSYAVSAWALVIKRDDNTTCIQSNRIGAPQFTCHNRGAKETVPIL